MPSRRFHNKLNKLLLKKDYDEINRLIDIAYFINPRKHREIWGHSKITPYLIYLYTGDINAFLAAYLHLKADKEISKDKEKLLLKLLELLGE